MSELSLTSTAVVLYSIMFLISVAVSAIRGHLSGWVEPAQLGSDLLLGLFIGIAVVGFSRLGMHIRAVRRMALDLHVVLKGLKLWQMTLMALMSGIAEEALFRGTLQPEIGLWASATLFAMLHIGPARRFLWWTAFAWVVGVGLGLLFQWRGTLVAPAVAHVVVNLVNLPYLSQMSEDRD